MRLNARMRLKGALDMKKNSESNYILNIKGWGVGGYFGWIQGKLLHPYQFNE